MKHLEDEEMNEATQLLARFKELDGRITVNAEERHRVNNEVNAAITHIADKIEEQDVVLSNISTNIGTLADSVGRVEQCLIGDPKFERIGLIKEVGQIQAKNLALEVRLNAAEEASRVNAEEIRSQKRMVIWTATILAAIGGIITWIKNILSP